MIEGHVADIDVNLNISIEDLINYGFKLGCDAAILTLKDFDSNTVKEFVNDHEEDLFYLFYELSDECYLSTSDIDRNRLIENPQECHDMVYIDGTSFALRRESILSLIKDSQTFPNKEKWVEFTIES